MEIFTQDVTIPAWMWTLTSACAVFCTVDGLYWLFKRLKETNNRKQEETDNEQKA